ncbi:MAG: beta-N-acetylhexosaminidase [Bacteroidetes bacterium]|nr:MAG: beta-N-acetylhexosaminidase [Bacteroidota bacterium]
MRICLLLSVFLFSINSLTQGIKIIPQPVELFVSAAPEKFTINSKTKIVFGHGYGLEKEADFFNEYLKKFYNLKLEVYGRQDSSIINNSIMISRSPLPSSDTIEGKYSLIVTKNHISISARNRTGLFYGFQTLIQLLPIPTPSKTPQTIKLSISQLTITDYPRFVYRGLHLDVGRHFMPVDFIKKYIDYIALHKMNYFHWHLTEDQGWRIEIKKYPRLTEVGSVRNGSIIGRFPGSGSDNIPHTGFYTQEQIKEVVKYAADRFVTIVPEIEMPGHGSAAIAAYPSLSCFPDESTKIPPGMISQKSSMLISPMVTSKPGKLVQETWGVFDDVFCAGKEETFKFLEDVIDEVVQLFPGKYIHVGGDESPKENWKRCPSCQKRMEANKLVDEHELQSYFIQRMEKYLNKKGKTLIGWDEILEGGLAPNAIVMSWRGEAGGIEAAKQKHEVIMTPGDPVYFDHSQSENEDSVTFGGYNPIEKVYAYEPVPKELNADQAKYVLGAQANLWTEYITNPKKVEYTLFPRLAALSEVLWSPKEKRDWNEFEPRLLDQLKRYEFWKANYSKALFDIKSSVIPSLDNNGVQWKLESKQPGVEIKYITHTAGMIAAPTYKDGKTYTTPVPVNSSMILAATTMSGSKSISNPVYQTFSFNKATGKKIDLKMEPSQSYPGDGAFTLVNGVVNEKGMTKSREYLGFSGGNCEATIDLGSSQKIKNVVAHVLREKGSWIWQPQTFEVFVSENGTDFTSVGLTDDFNVKIKGLETGTMKVEFAERNARYIKVILRNWGGIPEGNPGAGNKAWLFVSEIEVN